MHERLSLSLLLALGMVVVVGVVSECHVPPKAQLPFRPSLLPGAARNSNNDIHLVAARHTRQLETKRQLFGRLNPVLLI